MLKCIFEDKGEAVLRHVVVQAVVYREKKILLTKRAEGMLEGGKWALPGGFADRNETMKEAIAREIMEETGWSVGNLKLISIYDNPDRPKEDRQNVAFNYVCEAKEKRGEGDKEVIMIDWVKMDDPRLKQLAFDHSKVIEEFQSSNFIRESL